MAVLEYAQPLTNAQVFYAGGGGGGAGSGAAGIGGGGGAGAGGLGKAEQTAYRGQPIPAVVVAELDTQIASL